MNWITEEYIEEQAGKGRKEALECTQLHWQQLCKAGPKTLRKAIEEKSVDIYAYYCALCYRYNYKTCEEKQNCPLKCMRLWRSAEEALNTWFLRPTSSNWRKWRKAARAMLAKIDRLHNRLYPERRR